jgi:predicted restriction endonuclease
LGINLNLKQNQLDTVPILSVTKGDLFKKRSNWQNARSNIQNSARKIFFKNCLDPKCIVCGYTNHVEVAHIKAVSNFSEDSLISEINDISNLIGLCPNHHWEYDNGLLDISKYINHENSKK